MISELLLNIIRMGIINKLQIFTFMNFIFHLLNIQILRTYGFNNKLNPIIFTLDGKLIGGIDQFIEMAEKIFEIFSLNLANSISTKVTTKGFVWYANSWKIDIRST